jgi:hypothetical protein
MCIRRQPRGTWSDDGSLILCTTDSLLNHEFDLEDMGGRFVRWADKGLCTAWGAPFDIGVTTSDALHRIKNGTPAVNAGGQDEYCNGNGSLMHILPVVLRFAAEPIESFADHIIETIINKSEKVKELKNKAKDKDLSAKEKKQLTDEEREFKSKRKLVQEKLIKFATRIPAFMYLTDFRENTLQDVITKIETPLFETVTGLTVKDFHLLVRLKVFNTEQMNQAVFAFRRY